MEFLHNPFQFYKPITSYKEMQFSFTCSKRSQMSALPEIYWVSYIHFSVKKYFSIQASNAVNIFLYTHKSCKICISSSFKCDQNTCFLGGVYVEQLVAHVQQFLLQIFDCCESFHFKCTKNTKFTHGIASSYGKTMPPQQCSQSAIISQDVKMQGQSHWW